MKTLKFLCTLAFFALLAMPWQMEAQDNQRPEFVSFQTNHWNLDLEDGSRTEWMALEKEYFDKVTSKNEHIFSTAAMTHMYTADNSEVIHVTVYMNWDAIDKAQARETELIEAAWPDDDARDAFFDKLDKYYTGVHSDELYRTRPGAKFPATRSTEPQVIYIQKRHGQMPEDGTGSERAAVVKEYQEEVIHKNELVLGYYPMRHGWGSDSRDVLEVMVFDSFGDLEKSNDREGELIEAHWPDEAARGAFFDKLDKYFSRWHADYIYSSIPELAK